MNINEIKAFALTNNLIISPRKRRAWKLYCEGVYLYEFKMQTHGSTIREFMQPRIDAMFGLHAADSYDAAYIRGERRWAKWTPEEKAAYHAAQWERITAKTGIKAKGQK
jgi:predicted secreted Zn-dependent protease